MSDTRLNCATIHNNRRSVMSNRRHETAWHVFVAPRDGDVSIVMLGLAILVITGRSRRDGVNVP